jgi:hypothetical protein
MKIRFLYRASLAVAAALALSACSGSTTSPSSVSGAATLEGTVNATLAGSAMSAQSIHAQSAPAGGVTVTLMETGASTTTDGSGHFTLTNVPAGTVTLHFQAGGIDAKLTISGIVAGQTLKITVTVSGSNASLDQEQPEPSPSPEPSPTPEPSPSPEPSPGASCFQVGEHAEVEGNITATAASSITVDQEGHGLFQCQVSVSTEIRHGHKTLQLSDLHVGDHVHVSGSGLGSSGGVCQVQAAEIKLQ